jgi:estrone sulfotransferase
METPLQSNNNMTASAAFVSAADTTQPEEDDEQRRHQLEVQFFPVPATKTDDQFQKDFPAYTDGLVYSSPGGYVVLPEYPKKAETVYNLKPRPDDVYILTFPKCGK